MITYYFPPGGGGGAQRPLNIVKYAEGCGWSASVWTRGDDAMESTWYPDVPATGGDTSAAVARVPVPPDSNAWRMVPPRVDGADPWLRRVVDGVAAAHDREAFDAVLVTMPPYGLAPLIPALKAAMPGGPPVVLDLRDPWAFDGALSYRDKREWRSNRDWMDRAVAAADGVIVNTPEVGRRFAESFPGLAADRLTVVTNGFARSDFAGPRPAMPEGYEPGRFHLVHTGTLHTPAYTRTRGLLGALRKLRGYRAEPIAVSGRTPLHLLRAVAGLKRRDAAAYDRLSVVLVGVDDQDTREMVRASGVSDRVKWTGYRTHAESVAWARWADALFLPLHGLPPGHRSLIVPGKTYEYLAAGRPILAALPEGDARDLVEEAGHRAVAPTDEAGLTARLAELMSTPPEGPPPEGLPPEGPPDGVAASVSDYDREALNARLFAFLDHVVQAAAAERGVGR